MEGKLDSIAEEGAVWHKVVDDFYKPLDGQVSKALKGEKMYMPDQPSDEICDLCGAPMV
jgi:DNA topoisomerase-1